MADTLDARLLSCANFVRAGAVFADIGTDHGYLPIFLLRTSRICRAVLSDINKGPLNSARANVRESGLDDKCTFVLTDGARELSSFGATDYAIAGMGGELIARIILDAPHLKTPGTRLILQPMSRPSAVRECLYKEGFLILDERYTIVEDKCYLTLLSEYVGKEMDAPPEICEIGEEYPHPCDKNEYKEYLLRRKASLTLQIEGKTQGGIDTEYEKRLICLIDERLKRIEQ